MNSIKAFLSACALVNAESDIQVGNLTVMLQNGQPVRVFGRTRQSEPFTVMLIANVELLTEGEVATLGIVAEQSIWIVVVDYFNQVCGLVEPQNTGDLRIAARATIAQDELGSAITPPLPSITGPSQPDPSASYQRPLREWWHQVIRDYGRYRCYAFFLCLPSDEEAVKYLTKFGEELDLLSNEDCLVIALSKTGFRRSGYDKAIWNLAVHEQISKGYSNVVGQLFKIKYIDFPCIVFFEDIRSHERVVFSFKEIKAEEIAKQMRMLFTVIQQSVANGKKPIFVLEHHQNTERISKLGQSAFSKLIGFAKPTFEIAVENWIKTL